MNQHEGPESSLDSDFSVFSGLNHDNWNSIVDAGIPLYQRLKKAGDPRAEEVKNALTYLSNVVEHSGVGDVEHRAELRRRIAEIID